MAYKYLAFMRISGRHKPQWYIADMPVDSMEKWSVNTPDPFIIVKVSENDLQENTHLLGNRGLKLKHVQLQNKYQDTQEEYSDENGDTKTRINYGHFSEFGRTDKTSIPQITVDDIEVVQYE